METQKTINIKDKMEDKKKLKYFVNLCFIKDCH